MYRPEYFVLQEVLPKDLYDSWFLRRGEYLWQLFDDRVLWTADRLRSRYGKALVNTWLWGGGTEEAGFRGPDARTGTVFSQHRYGRALDLKFVGVDTDVVLRDILDGPWHDDFRYITGLETGVSWLHFDVRNWDKESHGVFCFSP